MTLDREERQRREDQVCNWLCKDPDIFNQVAQEDEREHLDEHRWFREAHERIEDLEEMLHARRLRCEELEAMLALATKVNERAVAEQQNVLIAERRALMHLDRAEGYRKAAIILRDTVRAGHDAVAMCSRCGSWTRALARDEDSYCWRHR